MIKRATMRRTGLLAIMLLAPGLAAAQGVDPLTAQLDQLIASRKELATASVSAAVVDVATGKVILARDADTPRAIASAAKIFTSVAALAVLGPEFRWRTAVVTDGWDGAETIKGDLVLEGAGDPGLSTRDLRSLVWDLKQLGVRRVTGKVAIDEGYFDSQPLPPGFDHKLEDQPYRAPVSALMLDHSTVTVIVKPAAAVGQPARVTLDPPSDDVVVDNQATTVAKGGPGLLVAGVSTPQDAKGGPRTTLTITGAIRADAQPVRVKKRIDHPGRHAAAVFRALLVAEGIEVKNRAFAQKTSPKTAKTRVLASVGSETLAVVIREMAKTSNNQQAEAILKTIGAEAGGEPGSSAKGLSAAREALEALGLRKTSKLENGSGLYDTTAVPARDLAVVLASAARDYRLAPDLEGALAIAGADGTLASRFVGGPGERYVRAKTGTLEGVVVLAGFAGSSGGRGKLAFAIIVNGLRKEATNAGRAFVDAFAEALVASLEQRK